MSDALPQILTADQLASELGLFDEHGKPHRRLIYRFVSSGLPHKRIGRSVYFLRDQACDYFRENTNHIGAASDFPQERRRPSG